MQFAFTVLVTLVDISIIYGFFTAVFNIYTAVALHFLLVLIVGIILNLFTTSSFDMRIGHLVLILIAFLGPMGGVLSILCSILHSILVMMNVKEEDPILRLIPEIAVSDVNQLYHKIIMDTHVDESMSLPTIFMDVLAYGSESQKRIIIERILRHFRPDLSGNLKEALNDPLASIRVFAATAVTRLEKQYSDQYHNLQNEVNQNPDNFDQLYQYAKHCEEYSKLEFIDDQRKKNFIDRAIKSYETCLNEHPYDDKLLTALAKLYFRCKYYKKTLSLVRELITENNQPSTEISKLYLSSLFELKMYDELREISFKNDTEESTGIIEQNNLSGYITLWTECSFNNIMKKEVTSGNC